MTSVDTLRCIWIKPLKGYPLSTRNYLDALTLLFRTTDTASTEAALPLWSRCVPLTTAWPVCTATTKASSYPLTEQFSHSLYVNLHLNTVNHTIGCNAYAWVIGLNTLRTFRKRMVRFDSSLQSWHCCRDVTSWQRFESRWNVRRQPLR